MFERKSLNTFVTNSETNIESGTCLNGQACGSCCKNSIKMKGNGKMDDRYDGRTGKRKRRFGLRLANMPKSFLLVKCCLANTLSLDEVPEEETVTLTTSSLSTVLNHGFNSMISEDCMMNFGENSIPFCQNDDAGTISSCKCIRRGHEPIMKIENVRIHARAQEQNWQKRNSNYVCSPLDSMEPRSRSQSRLTFASSRNNTFSRSSSLSEWHIPYEDISIEALVARSMKGPVYTGCWHGEVMVHRITKMKKEEFLRDISLLNLIRHENIILFMGASFESTDFAIITSPVKGYSLYTHIHEKKTMFDEYSKLSTVIQIAQGMEYLHAKRIELGKLCSRNVFLESKVKIAMTDYINRHIPVVKQCYGYIPDRQILYFSPELMKSLKIRDNGLFCEKHASLAGDVYAYGTILYEIFLDEYPHADEHLETVIWSFSSGRRLNALDVIQFAVARELFEMCWEHEALGRPSFQEILEILRRQGKRRLKRQHSISQPNVIDLPLTSSCLQFMEKSGND